MKRAIEWYIITLNSLKKQAIKLEFRNRRHQTKFKQSANDFYETSWVFLVQRQPPLFLQWGRIIWILTRKTEETPSCVYRPITAQYANELPNCTTFGVEPNKIHLNVQMDRLPEFTVFQSPLNRLTWLTKFQLLISLKLSHLNST